MHSFLKNALLTYSVNTTHAQFMKFYRIHFKRALTFFSTLPKEIRNVCEIDARYYQLKFRTL
jgi:hypothetical protein